jgi:acetylornithine deacetylase/succinyl-diaminopimelate desuccinylase-like protein
MHRLRFLTFCRVTLAVYLVARAKTVIPVKVTAKFSIRLVPDQNPVKSKRLSKLILSAAILHLPIQLLDRGM